MRIMQCTTPAGKLMERKNIAPAEEGVYAGKYEKTVFVCAKQVDNPGNVHYSEIIAFNAEIYAERALKSDKTDLQNVMRPMVLYGEAAKAYLTKSVRRRLR